MRRIGQRDKSQVKAKTKIKAKVKVEENFDNFEDDILENKVEARAKVEDKNKAFLLSLIPLVYLAQFG